MRIVSQNQRTQDQDIRDYDSYECYAFSSNENELIKFGSFLEANSSDITTDFIEQEGDQWNMWISGTHHTKLLFLKEVRDLKKQFVKSIK